MKKINIGTRGSKLALWQAYHVEKLLNEGGLETKIVIIETTGDKVLDVSLSKIGSKGVFTEELESALREGTIDIAVHSAKDVQSSLPEDLPLIAFLEREKANDVFVSHKKSTELDFNNLVIGTSSTRRRALITNFFPTAKVVDVRGNLQTRIRKMEEGLCDVLMLAYAGVHRMEYDDKIVEILDKTIITPSAGQGSVAIQTGPSLNETERSKLKNLLNHTATETCLILERAFMHRMEAGCSSPIYAHAEFKEEVLEFTFGVMASTKVQDLRKQIEITNVDVSELEEIGYDCAEILLSEGANEILGR